MKKISLILLYIIGFVLIKYNLVYASTIITIDLKTQLVIYIIKLVSLILFVLCIKTQIKIEVLEKGESKSLIGYIITSAIVLVVVLYFNSLRINGCFLITTIIANIVTIVMYNKDVKNVDKYKKKIKKNEEIKLDFSDDDKLIIMPQENSIVEKIINNNESFNRNDFVAITIDTFKSVMKAMEEKDIAKLKEIEYNSVFEKHKKLIELYNAKNLNPHYENINIALAKIINYETNGVVQLILTRLVVMSFDYVTNEENEIVSGSRKNINEKICLLTFAKDNSSDKWVLFDYESSKS